MLYRDLLPNTWRPKFIASHIRIPDGGPVDDWVHFHEIQAQFIFCFRGWVRVVYEDQGPPFVLREGDCVLQPPRIRHRVLESSAGLEVVEVASPADYQTEADPKQELPSGGERPTRRFSGQVFARHQAEGAPWQAWRLPELQESDFGFSKASAGVSGARVVRSEAADSIPLHRLNGDLLFGFVLSGSAQFRGGDLEQVLEPADAFGLARDGSFELSELSRDFRFLEISYPGSISLHPAG